MIYFTKYPVLRLLLELPTLRVFIFISEEDNIGQPRIV